MTAFTFSVEQLQSAPPEVRRWIAGEIARALGGIGAPHPEAPDHAAPQHQPMTLAACTVPEAARLFELIGNDAVAVRLFFELARENALNTNLPGLHALRTADLLHHVGLPGQDRLIGGLATIDRAFRQVHGEPDEHESGLFGFDNAGHVFLHEITRTSIHRVWEELVQARAAAEQEAALEAVPRVEGFMPPRVGPSVDIATHGTSPP